MNLRYIANTCCNIFLILMALFFLYACSQAINDICETCDLADPVGDIVNDGGRNIDNGVSASVNIIAVHNPNSLQYDDNCLNCHGGVPNEKSLDSVISSAHVAMLKFTPGENSRQCVWCHRNVSANLIQAASATSPFESNIRKHVDTQLCAICHGPVGPGKQFYQSGITTSGDPDGSQLYYHLCSVCHKELATSEVKGESAQEIYKAVGENKGGMAPLNILSPQWIQAIAGALGGDPTLPLNIPEPGTGASLYQQYCSSCHATLASSSKTGKTAGEIQSAINNNTGGMGSFSFLTTTQVQAIADALSGGGAGNGGTGGTDGATLYQANCVGCHGALASSSMSGKAASQIQSAINNNTGGMSSFSFLTTTQVQAIADALSGGVAPSETDGATLYQRYCSNCHGSLNSSKVRGESAKEIREAIGKNKGGMSSLKSITSDQIDAIAAVLRSDDSGNDD